ncbi:hypothetical protein GA0074695_1541 [Micromonospora viridifaciens]|uniref:Uncharacterized protein n=1 Tax=Micromonospora viridifaciens TaxID=1881 RepID=A0A1C4VK09_MICVI|nr:hypothetical protein [Micromonospora viridifaciens]SCE84303.1 hypothetical protein GA0074695_1541 [Micromonospora viridifaciens]
MSRPQRDALVAASYDPRGVVYAGAVSPRTLAALARRGLVTLSQNGTAATLTETGRAIARRAGGAR